MSLSVINESQFDSVFGTRRGSGRPNSAEEDYAELMAFRDIPYFRAEDTPLFLELQSQIQRHDFKHVLDIFNGRDMPHEDDTLEPGNHPATRLVKDLAKHSIPAENEDLFRDILQGIWDAIDPNMKVVTLDVDGAWWQQERKNFLSICYLMNNGEGLTVEELTTKNPAQDIHELAETLSSKGLTNAFYNAIVKALTECFHKSNEFMVYGMDLAKPSNNAKKWQEAMKQPMPEDMRAMVKKQNEALWAYAAKELCSAYVMKKAKTGKRLTREEAHALLSKIF